MRSLPLTSTLLQRAVPALVACALASLASCGPRAAIPEAEAAQPSPTVAPAATPAPARPSELVQLWNLGTAAINRQDWRAADAAFTRVLELNPTYAAALQNRAIVRLRSHRFGAARADFEAALALAPDDAALRRNAAIAMLWLGLDTSADALLAPEPAGDDTDLLRASLAIRAGRSDEALRTLDEWTSQQTDPDLRWRADLLRGVAHAVRSEHSEALSYFERAHAAAPTAPAPVLNRARVLLAAGRTADGEAALRRYLELAGPEAPDRSAIEALLAE